MKPRRRTTTRIRENGDHDHDNNSATRSRQQLETKKMKTNNKVMMLTMFSYCLILALASTGQLSAGAVVRPTIFSGLNGPNVDSPPNAQVTGQSQQQQTPSSTPQSHPNSLSVDQNGPQAPSTKINPFKSRFCHSVGGVRYDSPLGLQSLAIDDLALSASSFSNEQVGPHLARLNLDISGGAWCPMKPISSSNFGKEWIQVKLNRSYVISAIETQGRFGMGNGKEFVPHYQVEYSRNSGHTWHKWKDFRGSSLLRANEDVNSAVKNELSPPIVGANVIRILPYSHHLRTVCLRFELHGCPYDEGAPVAYATKDGVVEPRWGHLIDYTYDATRSNGYLSQGLGQLVDGIRGHDDFNHNSGFEWVGWKSMNGDVIIEFSFKTVRNFTGALFHSNNMFSNGVEVFQSVDVHYGIDVPLSMDALRDSLLEQRRRSDALSRRQLQQEQSAQDTEQAIASSHLQTLWSNDVMSIEYEPDKKLETSRPVTVHLKQRLANKLRFVLKFASKWILVSEVEFLSHPVELMSLASVDQHTTPALLSALSPAKTYDEFVAILREHQLRRIATNAYLESFGQSTQSSSLITSTSTESLPGGGFEPTGDQPSQISSSSSNYDDYLNSSNNYAPNNNNSPLLAGRRVTGPAIPTSVQQAAGQSPTTFQDLTISPSTNPMLTNQIIQPFSPMMQPPPTAFQQPEGGSSNSLAQDSILSRDSNPASISERRTMGLATVISFVLVAILVFLGALFAVSSYRLRHQPKLGSPQLPHHHLGGTGQSAKGLVSIHSSSAQAGGGPSLHNFMSVFSSNNQNNDNSNAQQHLYQSQDNRYNAIFATSAGNRRPAPTPRDRNGGTSLRQKLATLGHHSGGKTGTQLRPNQLLVSMKDSTGGKGPISTQLIVGLNQANPLAQQQVYSGCGQPTYNANYSTSMSMASTSTTTGHQGEYGDYAIPDAQPIIAPLATGPSPQSNNFHHQHQFNYGPGQQHLNPTFNASQLQQNLKQPFGGSNFQAEPFRASHRLNNQTLIEPQMLHQRSMAGAMAEHNYELIQHQEPAHGGQTSFNNQRNAVAHSRTLSNQLQQAMATGNECHNQQPHQQQGPFGSMTLGRGSHLQSNGQGGSKGLTLEECSPGSGSSASGQSGATTATTSANSSGGGSDLAQYYYANNNNNN